MALEASAVALRNVLNITVTEARAMEILDNVCTRYQSIVFAHDEFTFDDHSGNNVWSINDHKAVLEIFGRSVNNAETMVTYGVNAITATYDVVSATAEKIADAQKAVLLVWKSVESGHAQFYIKRGMTWFTVLRSCEESLKYMDGLSEQLLLQPDVEVKARAIFTVLMDAVYEDCRSSSLFDPPDHPRLKTFLRGISLLTPSESLKAPTDVPMPTGLFPTNLLQRRAYTFAFEQKRRSDFGMSSLYYKRVMYYKDRQLLYFPPQTYKRPDPGTSFRSVLLSMSVFGRVMAESIWHVVLGTNTCGNTTVANTKRLVDCYVLNYTLSIDSFQNSETISDKPRAVAADALGLASVFRALSGSDWHVQTHAWSTLYLSHAPFFYMLTTSHRCSEKWSPIAVRLTNAPLKQLENFASTFSCLQKHGWFAAFDARFRLRVNWANEAAF
ncbi:hypothetical protein HPB48_019497 [Haemaphysalis longicornis]|uniref:Uncharacterized protein n=1 Tax=Haemaphysalis longicornis TaxID=44386 RepID=A0A9J6GEB8_HAELO|nr:hypothetical protein HPB48_019497 [Haemaphysalis longicornis]